MNKKKFQPISILYEDKKLLIVDKPINISVHGGSKVKLSFLDKLKEEFNKDLFLLHRLDKETGGVLLVAKEKQYINFLLNILKHSTKYYIVICHGKFLKKRKVYRSYLKDKHNQRGQFSETFFEVKSNFSQYSLLKVFIKSTGRNHQIRRHLLEMSHPILGDKKYGNFELNKQRKETKKSLYLFAYGIDLYRYNLGKDLNISTKFPKFFTEFLSKYQVISTNF